MRANMSTRPRRSQSTKLRMSRSGSTKRRIKKARLMTFCLISPHVTFVCWSTARRSSPSARRLRGSSPPPRLATTSNTWRPTTTTSCSSPGNVGMIRTDKEDAKCSQRSHQRLQKIVFNKTLTLIVFLLPGCAP